MSDLASWMTAVGVVLGIVGVAGLTASLIAMYFKEKHG